MYIYIQFQLLLKIFLILYPYMEKKFYTRICECLRRMIQKIGFKKFQAAKVDSFKAIQYEKLNWKVLEEAYFVFCCVSLDPPFQAIPAHSLRLSQSIFPQCGRYIQIYRPCIVHNVELGVDYEDESQNCLSLFFYIVCTP